MRKRWTYRKSIIIIFFREKKEENKFSILIGRILSTNHYSICGLCVMFRLEKGDRNHP